MRRSRPGLVLLVSLACGAGLARAQPVPRQQVLSIGPMVGEPLGVTLRLFNERRTDFAWEAGLGWSQAGQDGLQFHAQHQWHLVEWENTIKGIGTFYLGLGGRVKAVEGTRLGVRGSIGINYAAPKRGRRWEAFLEVAPILDVTPDTHAFVNAFTGIRWFCW